jgi:hypothetical protein
MICLHIEFHIPSFNISLGVAMKQRAQIFPMVVVFLILHSTKYIELMKDAFCFKVYYHIKHKG